MLVNCVDIGLHESRGQGGIVRNADIRRRGFPDGDSWINQEAIVAEIFDVMIAEIRESVRRG